MHLLDAGGNNIFNRSGRALEDLRASIFNKFRPSESAKTQQQRIWGPVSALTFNFMVAVGIIFMNKWVRSLYHIMYVLLLALHLTDL